MTPQERENLKDRFRAIATILDGIDDMLLSLERENQGLRQNTLYTTFLGNVRTSVDCANDLADYIDHATEENWKVGR